MESPDPTLWSRWLEVAAQLVPRVCMVVVGAFACIRLRWVRRALRGLETSWIHRLTMMLIFGGLGVLGTHFGILVSIEEGTVQVVNGWVGFRLEKNQAVVGFRDTMALVGGLIGGPWVGLGAGLVAGWERYSLGGFAALGSGVATLVLGIFAGLVRHFLPDRAATPAGAVVVASIGTLMHRLLLLLFVESYTLATALTGDIALHLAVANGLGCVLFIWVALDLDRDTLENEAREARWREQEARQGEQEARLRQQEAELSALRAQVEPHFLFNTVNGIRALIRNEPDKARESMGKLADFLRATQKSANADTIPLREELEQLARYLDLQRLRFGEKLRYECTGLPAGSLDCRLPPRSLVTVAENAVIHARRGRPEGVVLRFRAIEQGDRLLLRLSDNGCGIAPERLAKLCKGPVESARGNGTGLHHLSRCLQLAFGGRADLAVTSVPGGGTEVVLTLPKEP